MFRQQAEEVLNPETIWAQLDETGQRALETLYIAYVNLARVRDRISPSLRAEVSPLGLPGGSRAIRARAKAMQTAVRVTNLDEMTLERLVHYLKGQRATEK